MVTVELVRGEVEVTGAAPGRAAAVIKASTAPGRAPAAVPGATASAWTRGHRPPGGAPRAPASGPAGSRSGRPPRRRRCSRPATGTAGAVLPDAGMLGQGLHPQEDGAVQFSRAAAGGGGGNLRLVPEDIEVAAQVDVRFAAGPQG